MLISDRICPGAINPAQKNSPTLKPIDAPHPITIKSRQLT